MHLKYALAATRCLALPLGRCAEGYLGIDPRRNQSGQREKRSHLARHGNALMRHVLWNAAKAAVIVKHEANPFRKLLERLMSKGRTYNYAIGAVCRKLVQVIYGVPKSQTTSSSPLPPLDPKRTIFALESERPSCRPPLISTGRIFHDHLPLPPLTRSTCHVFRRQPCPA